MTVADVARVAQTTERTVRRDIAAGILPAKKLRNGRLRIHYRDVQQYRGVHRLRRPHLKVEAYARLTGVSLRRVRRWIADGLIRVVRVSRRRIFILESEHRRVFGESLQGRIAYVTYAAAQQKAGPDHGSPGRSLPYLLSIAELAREAHTSVRHIHQDITKGLIPREQVVQWSPGGKLYIRAAAARAYLQL